MKIRAISLWQPWASLIAANIKKVETRSWKTPHRGLLAIHAAKRPITWDLVDPNLKNSIFEMDYPLGCVVAIVRLADCVEMTRSVIKEQSELELSVGDWQLGRMAWKLEDIYPLSPPVPAKGYQGMWNWEIDSLPECLKEAEISSYLDKI